VTGKEIIGELRVTLDRFDIDVRWTGFTVPWRVYGQLRSMTTPDKFRPDLIGGLEVYVVSRQEADCLKWHDRKTMTDYIRLMDEGKDIENRLTILLELAEERDWPEILEEGK